MNAESDTNPQIRWATSVSTVEPELTYRGYRVEDLIPATTSLETSYLLIAGELPSNEQLADWQALLSEGFALAESLRGWLGKVPATAEPLEVLGSALRRWQLGAAGGSSELAGDVIDTFPKWLGFVSTLVAGRARTLRNESPLSPRDDLSFAGNLWWMLQGHEPSPDIESVLELLLIVGAEHGLSPATIGVRLAAVAGTEFASALQTGISLCAGWQPVGQALAALDVLRDVRSSERAREWVAGRVLRQLPIAGFQHRVYRVGDPRTDLLIPGCQRAAESLGHREREELATAVEQAVWDQCQRLPAVIWPASRLLDYLGLERSVFGPLFVIARMAGWAAHFHEQQQQTASPELTAIYTGRALRPVPNADERR